MADADVSQRPELYKLYLSTAEQVSDRRAAVNRWMLSANVFLIALYAFLAADRALLPNAEGWIWLVAIPVVGILVCLGWDTLRLSYRKLNDAKYRVLHELERDLSFPAIEREQTIYRAISLRPLGRIENRLPLIFAAVHTGLLLVWVGAEAVPPLTSPVASSPCGPHRD